MKDMKTKALFFGTDSERNQYLNNTPPKSVKAHIKRDINCLKENEHIYKALVKFIDNGRLDIDNIRDYCQQRADYSHNIRINVIGEFCREHGLFQYTTDREVDDEETA
jgi:hypothetical protein